MSETLLLLLLVALGSLFVWKGSGLLESSAEQLSRYYRLPATVHGAVVVAVGSSFPELSSTVLSTLLHGEFDLGVSVVVGSAIFNILVIPGLSGLFGAPLRTGRELVFKEGLFYLIAVATLLVAFSLAVIYNPVEAADGATVGRMGRGIAVIPFVLYLLYLFIQQQDLRDQREPEAPTEIAPLREWTELLSSLLLILFGVEGLVRAAILLGELLGTPSFVWGVTMIAIVTSLPDTFVSMRLARRGKGVVSLSNVLGSNIFDLLVAVPAGVLIAGAATVNFAVAAPLMGVLTIATVALFAMMRTDLLLGKGESLLLLALYGLFLLWIILETLGVTSLL